MDGQMVGQLQKKKRRTKDDMKRCSCVRVEGDKKVPSVSVNLSNRQRNLHEWREQLDQLQTQVERMALELAEKQSPCHQMEAMQQSALSQSVDTAMVAKETAAASTRKKAFFLRELNRSREEFSKKFRDLLEQDLECTVCGEVFVSPIILNCSHTFCEWCVCRWTKQNSNCPLCRTTVTSRTRSFALDNYIEHALSLLGDETQQTRQDLLKRRKRQMLDLTLAIQLNATSTSNEQLLDRPPYQSTRYEVLHVVGPARIEANLSEQLRDPTQDARYEVLSFVGPTQAVEHLTSLENIHNPFLDNLLEEIRLTYLRNQYIVPVSERASPSFLSTTTDLDVSPRRWEDIQLS